MTIIGWLTFRNWKLKKLNDFQRKKIFKYVDKSVDKKFVSPILQEFDLSKKEQKQKFNSFPPKQLYQRPYVLSCH